MEYIRASQVTRVAGLIEAKWPALEVFRVVVDGKGKVSGVSAELLGKGLKIYQEKEQLNLMH